MSISSFTTVTMLDSRPASITISIPKTTDIMNRIITFKDLCGSASNSTIILVTRSGDTFEDGTFSTILSNAYQTVNLYAGQPGKWLNIDGGSGGSSAGLTTVSNLLNSVSTNVTSVSTNVATVSNLLNSVSTNVTSVSTNLATVSNTGRFAYVSTNTVSTNIVNAGYLVGKLPANTSATSVSPLAVVNGGATTVYVPQIEFQYNAGGYKHFMGSRHNDTFFNNSCNAIDFWLFSGTGSNTSTTPGTCNVNTMSVTAAGVGICNLTPSVALDVAGAGRFTAVSTQTISTNQLNSSNISNVTNQYFQYGGSITASIGGIGGQQGFLNINYPAAGTGHTNDGITYIWGGNANGDRFINLDNLNIGITVPKGYGNIWLNANTINVGTLDMYSNIICNVSNLNFITGASISNVNVTRTAALSTNTISTASITAGGTINITSPLTNCTGEIYASGGAIRIVGSSTTFDLWNYCSLTQVSGNLTINSYSNVTTTASSNININATSTIYISSGGNAINLSGNIDINNKNISNVNITRTAALSTNTISTNTLTVGGSALSARLGIQSNATTLTSPASVIITIPNMSYFFDDYTNLTNYITISNYGAQNGDYINVVNTGNSGTPATFQILDGSTGVSTNIRYIYPGHAGVVAYSGGQWWPM